jgi:hypothetical protein
VIPRPCVSAQGQRAFGKPCHLFRLSLVLQFPAVIERLVRNGNANLIRLHKHTDIPEDRA